MIWIYRSQASDGARSLAEALVGRRIRRIEQLRRMPPTDRLVCWGDHVQDATPAGVQILNGAPLAHKLADAERLTRAGVPTIHVSRNHPNDASPPIVDPAVDAFRVAQELATEFTNVSFSRAAPLVAGVGHALQAFQRLSETLSRPLPTPTMTPPVEWLPRLRNHVGGGDLLRPLTNPDFYVKKETLLHEYRVHSFLGRSIRSGRKVPRDGYPNPHPWIRSHEAGWRISYDGASVRQAHRDLAHQAVDALGLQFGAVDIGERADRSLLVLEVNRAPGLEGGTIDAYANAIREWSQR